MMFSRTLARLSGARRSAAMLQSSPAMAWSRLVHMSAGVEKILSVPLSDIGEGIAEAEILEWAVQPGDHVEWFDNIVSVQTDKATADITSAHAGVITKLHCEVGDMAATGAPLFDIDVDDDENDELDLDEEELAEVEEAAAPAAAAAAAPAANFKAGVSDDVKTFATPAVRRIARESDIDLAHVSGTGKDGRVLKSDILSFIKNGPAQPAASAAAAAAAPPAAAPATPAPAAAAKEDVVLPVRGLQRAMVRSMNAAWSVPHFGYCDELTMDALISVRSQLKPMAEAKGLKFSYMPFILKATSLALEQYPSLNAHVNADCSEVIQRAAHNIGVAMDSPRGLIVPNIKNVQDLTLFEIAAELVRLQGLATEGKLGEADLKDGTFTLSNIGAIGGTYASPVLFVPQVAIGALGKTSVVPRYDDDGNIVPTSVMKVSWAADHRCVDGATMARFSNLWRDYLQSPLAMLAAMK